MIDFAELFAFCDLHASRVRRSLDDMLHLPDLGSELTWPRYFDRQGFPIPTVDGVVVPTLVWARMREKKENESYVIVASDILPDGSRLSTVWLGLDHGFGGPPLIFETMRFSPAFEDSPILGTKYHPSQDFPDPFGEPGETTEQLRYTTEEEALAAHHEIVRRIVVREGH